MPLSILFNYLEKYQPKLLDRCTYRWPHPAIAPQMTPHSPAGYYSTVPRQYHELSSWLNETVPSKAVLHKRIEYKNDLKHL